MKALFTLFCLFLGGVALTAQPTEVIGDWEGVITQNNGGFRPQYEFSMVIAKDDAGQLYGRSYVSFDEVTAVMEFKGEMIDAKTFRFQESEIVFATELADMDWCIKSGKLTLTRQGRKWILTGPWDGQSEFGACVPGFIVLKKKLPRA